MSAPSLFLPDQQLDARHPRETSLLFGHKEAQEVCLQALRRGHLHHAWILEGPQGVGKATLAYSMARILLSQKADISVPQSFYMSCDDPLFRRIVAESEPRLHVLRRSCHEKSGKLRSTILIEEVRRLKSFLWKRPMEGGWRVVIIDSADELNINASNGLLKILEEPPQRTIFLLVSHQPRSLPLTLRSRCRTLTFKRLDHKDFNQAITRADVSGTGLSLSDRLFNLADGSVGMAFLIYHGKGELIYNDLLDFLSQLPKLHRHELWTFAQRAAGKTPDFDYDLIISMMRRILEMLALACVSSKVDVPAQLKGAQFIANAHQGPLWAQAAVDFPQRAQDAKAVNLDPAHSLFHAFLKVELTAHQALSF